VNDDWRLHISFKDEGLAHELSERMSASELEHDLEDSFGDTVIVSRDGDELFAYSGTREQAEKVDGLVRSLAGDHDWNVETELRRWHPDAEEWEDPDAAVPASGAERDAEHEQLIERERASSEGGKHPEWEVRIDLPGRSEAEEFEKRLQSEGFNTVRRWKYVIVGAEDEDSAKQLAGRFEQEAPEGSTVTAEGTWQEAWEDRPPNPFAVFGGLGG
jgi:hypothetical protein